MEVDEIAELKQFISFAPQWTCVYHWFVPICQDVSSACFSFLIFESIPHLLRFSGDFNSDVSSAQIKDFSKSYVDAWPSCGDGTNGYTFSSGVPKERIDFLFMAKSQKAPLPRCLKAIVPNTLASDHFPLRVDVNFA